MWSKTVNHSAWTFAKMPRCRQLELITTNVTKIIDLSNSFGNYNYMTDVFVESWESVGTAEQAAESGCLSATGGTVRQRSTQAAGIVHSTEACSSYTIVQ